ncbi:16S rRNA (guanine1207-N2)-methyltransferase [Paracoccus aminovorans]|uniref:16S rRNA (Guanine1207-N2)-methyltransferase n=1 Tax=Paracoccus aminovorans TaxID=34004 RepID=A0A1I3AID6_9RHOB|nr:methyltransferase [Paracoccus aminovorans]CQR86583.1 ribosomal RNA small subunit methyltransferase C [Paracoccus aminovorans]SFH49730.1 16S rRNA (guanine1207-N2)-methyltransferase [Paracoccus aminovorans]
MAGSRLELVFGGTPPEGRLLLVGAGAGTDLDPFDPAHTQVVQGFFPDHQALTARGFAVATSAAGGFETAVVFLPRARAAARARIAEAAAHLPPGAALWVDGQKTDGVDAVLKELRGLAPVDAVQSRAHGKIFRVTLPQPGWLPGDWAARDHEAAPGMVTRPGVFSADGPDPASQALAAALPEKLPTRIVDLGAGWGWLSAQILTHPGVETLHLVEADASALDCARRNVTDPRAQFHWADALDFHLSEPVNGVIMNPPFHEGRAADPRLGAGFIRAAAGLLTGAGRLWMVANRHLPYEQALRECFAEVSELGGDTRFKILTATGARRAGAGGRGQPKGRRR